MDEARCALIIANSQYNDPVLRQLEAPTGDAEALAKVLMNPSIGGFKVHIVLNQPSYKVKQETQAFFGDRRRNDLLLLYFSGHGIKDEDGELYFATVDTNHKYLQATAVEANFVNNMMRKSSSRRQVLLLDCCHSGAFARGMVAKGGLTVGTRDQFEGRGRVVLTASDATQYSFEGETVAGEGIRSVFTRSLISGLETGEADRDCDGFVSLNELYSYVHDSVIEQTPNQRPRKWDLDVEGEIIIARNPRPTLLTTDLPFELREAVVSRFPGIREDAVHELRRLLQGRHKGLALAAHKALIKLKEDDSRRVSRAAEKLLAEYAESLGSEGDAAERRLDSRREAVRTSHENLQQRRKVDTRRATGEKAKQEQLDQERAERAQAAVEKAERERHEEELARQEAVQPRLALERDALSDVPEEVAEGAATTTLTRRVWDALRTYRVAVLMTALACVASLAISYFVRRPSGTQQAPGSNSVVSTKPAGTQSTQGQAAEKPVLKPSNPSKHHTELVSKKVASTKPAVPGAVHLNAQEMQSKLVYDPAPPYPQAARAAQVQGTVRLYALVDRDGTIKVLKVISGHPLLVKAAMDGIKKWRYQPTLRNGQPVAVETEIDVHFTLRGGELNISESDTSGGQPAATNKTNEPISPPVPIYRPTAPYTEAARMKKVQGVVKLMVSIDDQGTVTGAKVIGHLEDGLDKSAADTVRTWKFKPATRNGVPVPVTIKVNIDFKIY